MPISVTCQCGARLEIDEKFLGKEIPCPDCHRPLPTQAPAVKPPPLELPNYRRTSGLAVLSLALALVGAFTIVGTIAAIVVGVFALKDIAAKSSKLEGLAYARAGIIVGAVCTFITLAALISPTVFGLDSFLRQLALAGRVQYPPGNDIESAQGDRDIIVLTRQSPLWGAYLNPQVVSNNFQSDDLILVNITLDAFISCQFVTIDGGADNEEDKLKKVIERLRKSELVNLVFRLGNRSLDDEAVIVENKLIEGDKREITLDIRDRRFLVQFPANNRDQFMMLVGVARRSRFERIQPELHKTFETSRKAK